MVRSKGTSTAIGERAPHSLANHFSFSEESTLSSKAPSSALPGSSSSSKSATSPNLSSNQLWNAVPRRAIGSGLNGSGLLIRAANSF